jgi:hypothetical protein
VVVHRYAATLSMEMHQPVMLDPSGVGPRLRRQRPMVAEQLLSSARLWITLNPLSGALVQRWVGE